MQKSLLITGGAGFIGSHVVRRFLTSFEGYRIVNLDALTYAGNLENLLDVEHNNNYVFVRGDIADTALLASLFQEYDFEGVVHLAAESHVDRSITNPLEFVRTNVLGTVNLLNAARNQWGVETSARRFYHVSTDEVYGSLGAEGLFTEETPYDPRSPYSASKASSDHFVRAWYHTYGLPVVISNCSNNYGANQFPEKLLPLAIHNIQHHKPVPIYGDGRYTRDWLWVEDHARAIEVVYRKGVIGETYNIGGFNEWQNIDLIHALCRIMDQKLGRPAGDSANLITFVKDRPGHDKRYAIDATRIATELGWKPSVTFEQGLEKTVDWYLANTQWLEHVTSGAYQQYYKDQYASR
ncbi:MAG: dTDP-glucose 4,6-dehydratase [Bacteroidetes bacterium]|nr:dTDP-glucose 4,6-dehydratase [Bacteroidota bacterium]